MQAHYVWTQNAGDDAFADQLSSVDDETASDSLSSGRQRLVSQGITSAISQPERKKAFAKQCCDGLEKISLAGEDSLHNKVHTRSDKL